ncbi:MAG: CHRD domain-containing protein [Myxacorys californica WJT36-NPBG1]|jgi:hypothetical protein|nr:CHRD domain-containing protein [Myxacorys californica WJT36-NPBG1]
MKKNKRVLVNFLFALVTCVAIIGLSSPSFSSQIAQSPDWLNQQLLSNLQQAESVITAQMTPAQDMPAQDRPAQMMPAQMMPTQTMTRYVAVLTKDAVVPTKPSNAAFGAAGAVLVGDRLVMRGDFSNLSSPLRDYATDPVSPANPNITSAVHIHRGESTKNGPFQYALTVNPNESGMGGRFAGEYTLTSEQQQALSNGMLYVDIHTKKNRAGELRGILRSY